MAELFGDIDELQDSEKRTISYFADSLNSDWTLIPHIELDEGEIDLLVMHKTLGGLVFEVKGGRVFVQEGSWYSQDRYGKTHSIKDPYIQAENNMFTLKKYLKKVMMYNLSLHYAACFPDIPYFDFKAPHVDEKVQTFSRKELKDNLQDRITKILDQDKKPRHVPDVVERIKAELKPSINSNFSILSQVDYINSKILELEEKQFEAMKMLMNFPKLYVEGSAGTGKTLIAINFAKTLLASGKNVLFVCYTNKLGEYIYHSTTQQPLSPEYMGKIYAGSIISYARNLFQKLIQETENYDVVKELGGTSSLDKHSVIEAKNIIQKARSMERRGFIDSEFDNYLVENLYVIHDLLEIRIDCVIIDECQDFKEDWQVALSMIQDEKDKKFFMFGDPEQTAIENWKIIDGFSENTIFLKQNLRNTNEINTFVNTLFNKNVDSSDINGDEVDQYVFSSQDIASQINELEVQLSKILNELKNEGYELSDIAILTTHAQRIKDIKSIKVFGKKLSEHPEIEVTSSLKYKGLEKNCVIAVFPTYNFKKEERLKNIIYTGLTRAKVKLVLLISEDLKKQLESLANKGVQ
tara:strand:- start:8529 stop:10265 length:1737 start_codon:yes stop_codon:yes gene_type:complete